MTEQIVVHSADVEPVDQETGVTKPKRPWHPVWCQRRWCNAYDVDAQPALHRSEPSLIRKSDDPENITYYVFTEATRDGSDPHVHIVAVEIPYRGNWWEPVEAYEDVLLTLREAEDIFGAMTRLLTDARTTATTESAEQPGSAN